MGEERKGGEKGKGGKAPQGGEHAEKKKKKSAFHKWTYRLFLPHVLTKRGR